MIDLTGMNQISTSARKILAIKEAFPDINWDRFEDIDRALNAELWHGPWNSNWAEPLENYRWAGFAQACKDIEETLKDLPYEVYYDVDAENVCINNPEDDPENWIDDEFWVGGEYEVLNTRKTVMYPETYKQIF